MLAERGNWIATTRMIEKAKCRFGVHAWVLEVLNGLVGLAEARVQARFRNEALFSTTRINTRLTAKEEALSPEEDARMMSFMRRKGRQGKAGRRPNGGESQD